MTNSSDTPSQSVSVDQEILKELRKMRKIITLANSPLLERELGKYATSPERRKIWINIDGKKRPSDIAKDIGISTRAVEIFVKTLTQAELVEPRGHGEPPKRSIDLVPARWLEELESKSAKAQLQTELPVTNAGTEEETIPEEIKSDG